MEISVVVPVYKSEKIIDELCKRLLKVLEQNFANFEIILINDASPDRVADKMNNCAKHPQIFCYSNKTNLGQLVTTRKGILMARGKYIVTIDDDLEYDPSDILKLYNRIVDTGLVVVFGLAPNKYEKQGKSSLLAAIRNKVLNVLWNKPVTDSFKIFRRDLVFDGSTFLMNKVFEAFINKRVSIDEIGYVGVSFSKRFDGSSNYSRLK